MTASSQHIVTCFESLGMTPEQIAEAEQFDVSAVKSILYQNSHLFRDSVKEKKELDFTDEQLVEANEMMLHLMRYSEDENLKYRIAKNLRDDKKGRKDIRSGVQALNINITQINKHLHLVKERMAVARTNAKSLPAANGSTDRSALGNIKEGELIEV